MCDPHPCRELHVCVLPILVEGFYLLLDQEIAHDKYRGALRKEEVPWRGGGGAMGRRRCHEEEVPWRRKRFVILLHLLPYHFVSLSYCLNQWA